MKILAIVTISLCWTSIALAGRHRKDRFSALLEPQYIGKVGKLPPPYDYMKSAGEKMSVYNIRESLTIELEREEQKRIELSEAMEKWKKINKGRRNPQWERAHDLANELDRMTYTDNSLGLPFDDLRRTYGFCAFVPEEARLEILGMMKKFGQSRLNSRLLVAEYQVKLLRMRINESYDRTTKEKDLDKLDYVRRNIPTVQKELAAREVRYNALIEPFQKARDTDVNDKGKAPMGHGVQTSADQVGPQNYPFPCPEQTPGGHNQEDLYTIVAQRPQSNDGSIYAGDSGDNAWASNQGGSDGGQQSEAYINQPETSTLGYQEFPGDASGLGHGAKRSSVYQGLTLMHDSYLYHGGQTSVDQIVPQNLPVLLFPEQTPGGHNQEDLYTIVAQRPQSNDGSIYAGDSGDNAWASNQGGSDGGQQSEAYINQPEESTLGYQEFHGGASGLGHGAKHSSVYEGSTLMHDSYLYHDGQTSVDQIEPQNRPVLPFPEQTARGYNQEHFNIMVAHLPLFNYDSWRHGEGHTSASQVDAPMDHTPTYDGGQTSVDQIEPQNRPVLPFPEQTARGYNQEHFNIMVAHLPQFNYDSWRHGADHTSASQVDTPMHPRDHGSDIGQNLVHGNSAHREDQYTLKLWQGSFLEITPFRCKRACRDVVK
ncbi:hypothetical protein SeLEV6574_g04347 [Synchytrium endobioticum]|uniref:Uncharacterized protein n=1 Tax=Synchytrium endobioticum TaxID=286115 RepID=A0A507CZX0_9FUNG|nr:hypothetical protein SeLEV6574_g04347 [Synchytrium endobioticum]